MEGIKFKQDVDKKENGHEEARLRLRDELKKLIEKAESMKTGEEELLPRTAILADKDSIKNQQIDMIVEEGNIAITFKLSKTKWLSLVEDDLKGQGFTENEIVYKRSGENKINYRLCGSLKKEMDDLTIHVARSPKFNRKLSSFGLVRIEVPLVKGGKSKLTPDDVAKTLEKIMEEVLHIADGIVPPTETAERGYKLQRYRWSHKVPEDRVFTPHEESVINSELKREEVAPGYFTFVESGRTRNLQRICPFFLYHKMHSPDGLELHSFTDKIIKVIKSGEFVGSHERYRRGMRVNGWSTMNDLRSGGGDGVFLRLWADRETDTFRTFGSKRRGIGEMGFVFSDSILDRTDYYCYRDDSYGSKRPAVFKNRMKVEDLLYKERDEGFIGDNEIVFQHGLSLRDVRHIVVDEKSTKNNLIEKLKEAGISEVNGQSLGDFILVADNYVDVMKALDSKFREDAEKIERRDRAIEWAEEKEKRIKFMKKFPVGSSAFIAIKNEFENIAEIREVKINGYDKKFKAIVGDNNGEMEKHVLPYDFIKKGKNLKLGDVVLLKKGGEKYEIKEFCPTDNNSSVTVYMRPIEGAGWEYESVDIRRLKLV